jgi:hypothetical protein
VDIRRDGKEGLSQMEKEMGPRGRGRPMGKTVGYTFPLNKLPLWFQLAILLLFFSLLFCRFFSNNFKIFYVEIWNNNSEDEMSSVIPGLQFILVRRQNTELFTGAVLRLRPNPASAFFYLSYTSNFALFLAACEEVEFPDPLHQSNLQAVQGFQCHLVCAKVLHYTHCFL